MDSLIIIVEGESDKIYISKIIKTILKDNNLNNIKLNVKHSKGKGNIIEKTEKEINNYIDRDYKVIIVMDTDLINSNQKDIEDLNKIQKYIEEKNYEFVFFNKNIEDVLDVEVKGTKKRTGERYNVKYLKRLENNNFNSKGSNLHIVIDKIIDEMLKKN